MQFELHGVLLYKLTVAQKVNYHVQKNTTPIPIPSQMNQYTPKGYFSKIHFNNLLSLHIPLRFRSDLFPSCF
jgi:hypothetical protein